MRKIVVSTFMSLDGVMQAPGGPEEDPSGGFELGGWSVNYWDEMMGQVMAEATSKPFAMLLGRKTYDIMAAHWPHAPAEEGGEVFNRAHKYVVSNTLEDPAWQPATVIGGDVVGQLRQLREQDGPDLQVSGSGQLVQTLLRHDLVDELYLWVFPVLLGRGKRLFADGTIPAGLRLVDNNVSTTGVVIARYARAGEVSIGSFALEQPTEAEVERRQRLAESGG
jgi:dihydrofolate reductase